ncbi:TonB-dependent receptor plug domain-containing protein [Campylobacter sp. MOP51]|uniref:TonB-dependent receptor plug domain-containing protein n=1 Tax=Campylobacter canis TaxID=3378588 RepID=UPI003C4192F4
MDVSAADKEKHRLSDVRVDANSTSSSEFVVSKKDDFQGTTTISRKMIEATPSGNGDITSLIKANPSVKFSNTNRQSTTMGEIDPADISINGSKFYQNSFIIDGMNINNDIDPVGYKTYNVGMGGFDIISSSSQGMAIDSDFIESLDVHDSDVSAKYGGFTGGVIDAKTRDPKKGFHGKFSMSHTRDSWTKYHINEADEEEFQNSTDALNQPKFKKFTTRLNLEGFLSDDFGLMFGYANTRSKIPVKDFYNKENTRNQRRNIDNYFLKALWYANDRLSITPSIIYSPQKNQVFSATTKDSDWYFKSGGLSLNLNADYEFDFATMKNKFSYSNLETSRDAKNEYRYVWHKSSDKNWGIKDTSAEGGFGDIYQKQKTYAYNLDFDFNEFEVFGATHKFLTGLELKKQEAFYEIKNTFVFAGNPGSLRGALCDPNDKWCLQDDSNGGRGQFFRLLGYYNKGKISVKQNSWAYYIEDKIEFDRLTLRPGLRFGGDDYMDKKTVAPRFSASYDVFGDDDTVLSFGRNRYYGRNIFSYRLKDGQNSLLTSYARGVNYNTNWRVTKGINSYNFHQLDIPYDDETSYGLKQKLSSLELNFKYIKRKGRDQIIRSNAKNLNLTCTEGSNPNCFIYSNGGYSDTKTWNIALRTFEPLKIMNTNHTFELSYDRFKTKTNATNYETSENLISKDIYYDGKIIPYDQLPALDYDRPWTLRFTTVSEIPQHGLTFSNFLSYKGSVDAYLRKGVIHINGAKYDRYERVQLGKSFSWDSRIGYEVKLPKNMSAFVNLDIYNILNRSNKAKTKSTNSADTVYESGRQFWLEAGLKW